MGLRRHRLAVAPGSSMCANLAFVPATDDLLPPPVPPVASFDALVPLEMARRAETVGKAKANLPAESLFALAVLGGAFIALGAIFSTTVAAESAELPYGVARLLIGVAFSLGLILVIVGGAELFTGNALLVMAWAARHVTARRVLRNWAIVYAGNFAGALATAGLMAVTQQYTFGGGSVGRSALATANAKCQLGFVQAIALGILCNVLVCLAVWLCFSARSTVDRVLAIVFPVSAFVAAGFEHSIANMYFIPLALFVKATANDDFWALSGTSAADYPDLTWSNFVMANLLPVTIGNVVGGTLMVGAIYWFIYLRNARPAPA